METSARFETGNWVLFSDDPVTGIRRYRLDLGNGTAVMRTEYHRTEELLAVNHEEAASNLNTRWGDGKVVARIPMNVLFNQLGEAVRDGDDAYVNRWLNDPDHAKFRTRGGKL